MISGPARCSFALRPARSLTPFKGAFSIEGSGRLVTSSPAPTATGWSDLPGGFLSTLPLESRAFLTAHFNSLLAQLPRFCDRTLVSCGARGAFSDYCRLPVLDGQEDSLGDAQGLVDMLMEFLGPGVAVDSQNPSIACRQAHGDDLMGGKLSRKVPQEV